jgi:N-acetylneuraminic acid mutarotase
MRSPSLPRALVPLFLLALAASACGGGPDAPSAASAVDASAGWERVASMPQRRSYIAAARVGRFIYTAGGMVGDTGRPLATFTRYDTGSDRWTMRAQLPVATRAAAAAAVDGVVYVIGGTTPEGNTAAVWAWDGRAWRSRAPLPAPRFNHAAVALGKTIWVFGGFAGGSEHADVFAYDTRADRWRRASPLPRPNHTFGAVAFGGEIWLIGGRRGERILREVWILDPDGRGRWRPGPALPRAMELLGAAVSDRQIHAVWESVYQIYDAATGRWRQGPRPLVTRHALKAFAVGGALYTVGGCTTALRDSPIVERREL